MPEVPDRPTGEPPGGALVLEADGVCKSFRTRHRGEIRALDGVSIAVRRGAVCGLIGPDAAGKTTLLRLAAGILRADRGRLTVLGRDVARQPLEVQRRIGYMPQRFGLYEDLTVQENLDLYADLQGVAHTDRRSRYGELMKMTGLGAFTARLAGRLSGGMKQKLGLACTLVRSPALLLLDEATVGVDPVSRRELWDIVYRLVGEEDMTVLLSTAYLDEAERCDDVVLLHEGKVIGSGVPAEFRALAEGHTWVMRDPGGRPRRLQRRLLARTDGVDATVKGGRVRFVTVGTERPDDLAGPPPGALEPTPPRFEDGFMMRLRESGVVSHDARPSAHGGAPPAPAPSGSEIEADTGDVVVAVRDLERRFGSFRAVQGISFEVRRGEIFGLLGPNGAGKSTTFRMLCGLLPVSEGSLRVAGVDLRRAPAAARQRVGYMAQQFSQYGQLSVAENLKFFASAYGLLGERRRERIEWALEEFDLARRRDSTSGGLPVGFKQRLAMACALMHEPEILFLDEPTSGVDPIARRAFWARIGDLADAGVTVIITTHFLEEAEYCDRLAIMISGEILALGSPEEIRARARPDGGQEPTVEDAFVAIVENASRSRATGERSPAPTTTGTGGLDGNGRAVDRGRLRAPVARERPSVRERRGNGANGSAHGASMRLRGLMRKEAFQVVRDPSSIAIALLLPVALLLLFGYGVRLDPEDVPIALVVEDGGPGVRDLVGRFRLSPYFAAVTVKTMARARAALARRDVDGIVWLRSNFTREAQLGEPTGIQVVINGVDANRAAIISGYVEGVWSTWLRQRLEHGGGFRPPLSLRPRIWFNEEVSSQNFLVPGLIALIMTLIGALLTALVMAREWERGTMEALLVTPVRVRELLLGKMIPYFSLGMGGMALSVLMAVFLFGVPLRSSVMVLLVVSSLFLLAALGMGLLISTIARNQFVAGQVAIIATFLPAFFLSGFIFDIGSAPLPIQIITRLVAARYFVSILQTVFLAGDVWIVILPNAAALLALAAVFLGLTRWRTRKRLD